MFLFRYMLFLLLLFVSAFSMPPAGILISNTAQVEYEDETGFKYKGLSNTVTIQVEQVYGIEIHPDFQSITAFPGSRINISYILKNTGNGKDRYTLQIKNKLNDDGDIENLRIYIDTNENGILDPGEQEYPNANPPIVKMGGFIPLLITGSIPSSLQRGKINISLEGYSLGNDQISDIENITEISVSPEVSISLKKEANRTSVYPSQDIDFSITVKNYSTKPVSGIEIETDFDNDGVSESRNGVLIEDEIPPYTSLKDAKVELISGIILYKGKNDNYWKNSIQRVSGKIKTVALFVNSLDPDQQARLSLKLSIDNDAPAGNISNTAVLKGKNTEVNSNTVVIEIKEKKAFVLDDTDDNDSYTGSNSYTDNDDTMVVNSMTSGDGMYVDFVNEAWNLGNTPVVINVVWDKGSSKNFDENITKVIFLDINKNPLTDTNKDGYLDLGILKPGERVRFITRVFIQKRSFTDVVIAVKGFIDNPDNADFTFNIIKNVQPVTTIVDVTVSAGVGLSQEKLKKQKVVIYEFDNDGNRTDRPPVVLWTDDNGAILYDEDGNLMPLYNVLRYGKKYRLTIYGEYKGNTYYLSPYIQKVYFDEVENTGEERCWDKSGNPVQCSNSRSIVKIKVLNDGTKELLLPLDPAGYVYDPVTKEKIMNACVYFYRCSDSSCNTYILVDNDLLDYYSNPEKGRQTNPQLTSAEYGALDNEGTFEFIFRAFDNDTMSGWYFLEVDFECAGADKTLKDKYQPVRLQKDKIWNPYDYKPYRGEKFYIDEDFPGTIGVIIPLGKPVERNLIVRKQTLTSIVSTGDFARWKISVKNSGDTTAYDVSVNDYLPRGFRYKKDSTKINGIRGEDPTVSKNGRVLTWDIGNLNPGEEKSIEFYTYVITSATEGRHKNTADALGYTDTEHTTEILSNQAFDYIKVSKGVFTDKGYIFGKVFIDQNNNKIHDENEPVIKGVKIYLDNGRYAVTDVEGKYHFDRLNPRTYVVKIDKTTLPKGAKLVVLNNRNAGDPSTVFADIYPGEMHKVNFALAPFNPELQIIQTRKKIKGKLEIERGIEDIFIQPLKSSIKVKHYVLIRNKSKQPLYEIVYSETSKAVPEKGTVYINGSPFKDPKVEGDTFSWNIPVLLPEEKVKITWISSDKKGELKPLAKISLKVEPSSEKISLPVDIPVEFDVIKHKEYELTVYFDFGSAELSPQAKKSLERIVSYLRKTNFTHLFIRIKAHTDAVRVINPEIKDNALLSLKRAENIKNFLKKYLIDLKRVEIK